MRLARQTSACIVLALTAVTLAACSDGDDPITPENPIASSTWAVESSEFASSVSDFLITFDESRTVTRLRYMLEGSAYDYEASDIIGSAVVDGSEVDIRIDWGVNNDFEFLGFLNEGRTTVDGTVAFDIEEGSDQAFGFGDAVMNRR